MSHNRKDNMFETRVKLHGCQGDEYYRDDDFAKAIDELSANEGLSL